MRGMSLSAVTIRFAAGLALAASTVVLAAPLGCASKPPPPVAKVKAPLGPIETPDNLVAIVLVRDPVVALE